MYQSLTLLLSMLVEISAENNPPDLFLMAGGEPGHFRAYSE